MNKYKITIFGEVYTLVSDEPEEHVMRIACVVDALMRDTTQATNLQDIKKIAVLSALQLAKEVVILEEKMEQFRSAQERLISIIDASISR